MGNNENSQIRGYANLLNDYMFKRVFGSEECKDILISFLNRIIGNGEIEDVTFQNPDHLGPTDEDRRAVFDISVRTKTGEEYIIEMQLAQQEYFRDRALFYASYPILHQAALAKEEFRQTHNDASVFRWNFKLKPVRFIAVVNFPMKHGEDWNEERCFSSYRLREESSGELFHDKLQFIFLELARFDKSESELESYLDMWMYLFKNMASMADRPKIFEDKEFDHLFEIAQLCNFTAEQYKYYQNSQKMIYDYENTIDFARKEGHLKGRQEGLAEGEVRGHLKGLAEGHLQGFAEGEVKGREKGREEGIKEIARKMLMSGMSVEQVSALTGLSETQIQELTSETLS